MHGRIFLILTLTKLIASIHLTFAQTQVLTFDEIPNPQLGIPLPNGYGGLRWTNLLVANGFSTQFPNAVVSRSNILYTPRSGQALIYSGLPFDLDSAWVTAGASGAAARFSIVAMFGPLSLFTNTYTFPGNTATLLHFGLRNITAARLFAFESSTTFAMDNLAVSFPEDRRPSLPGWFKPGEIYFPPSDALAIGAGDLNHDGHSELVISSRGGTTVAINIGSGGFILRDIISTNNFAIASANFIAIGDFSGDGHEDAVISTSASSSSFNNPITRLIEFTNYFNFTTNGISNVFGVVAIGNFGPTNRLVRSQTSIDIVPADFNGDGYLDYIELTSDQQGLYVSTNNGTGIFATAFGTNVFPFRSSITVNDFDSDGDIDFATANQANNTFTIFYNSGKAKFPRSTNYNTGLIRPIAVASADLDGDDIPDVVVRNVFSGLSLLRGLGSGRFAPPIIITEGGGYPSTNQFPRSIALHDLNSDGAPDIAFISGTEVVTLLNIFPPRINIDRIEDIIEIPWPTNFAKGAVIEYTTDIGPDAVWSQDTFPPLDIGETRAIFDSGRLPQLFFRLRRPE